MRTRSKALYNFLLHKGVLSGTQDTIAAAKKEYRALYKREWKSRAIQKKEIRFEVTVEEYQKIQLYAKGFDLKPTTYAKAVVLQFMNQHSPLDNKLLEILQLVSMATIATSHDPSISRVHFMISNAETLLLAYLNRPTYG